MAPCSPSEIFSAEGNVLISAAGGVAPWRRFHDALEYCPAIKTFHKLKLGNDPESWAVLRRPGTSRTPMSA